MVRGTALSNYSRLVTELGGDPLALLRAAGIRSEDIGRQDIFVSLRGAVQAIESAAAATHTPDFGRRLALRQGIEILGPVGVAARTAATVSDAMAIFAKYMAAYSPAVSAHVDVTTPQRSFFEFRITLQGLPSHCQTSELSLGVTLKVLRLLLGAKYAPLSVHLPHEPLSPAVDYVQYYGCTAYFAEPRAGFTMRTADLKCPLDHDELAHQAVVEYLGGLIVAHQPGTAESVRTIARQLLPTGAAALEVVAAHLNMHPKTLQRRLAAEGTSFSALLDSVRRETAEHYLRDTQISLSHLARQLGYTEQGALTRSCQRWFGTGPMTHRRTLRSRVQ